MLHLKISSQRRVPLESLLSSSAMILMRRRISVGAAFELNIVLQNELNMTRWDPKNRQSDNDRAVVACVLVRATEGTYT